MEFNEWTEPAFEEGVLQNTEAVVRKGSVKKMLLKVSQQNPSENTSVKVSFLINPVKFAKTPFLQSTSGEWIFIKMIVLQSIPSWLYNHCMIFEKYKWRSLILVKFQAYRLQL